MALTASASHLLRLWMDAGLLYFGDFAYRTGRAPFLTRFDLLGSYPDVLGVCAQVFASSMEPGSTSRLLCASDSLPLGLALSLRTGIPLVYSRGRGEPPVDDLVGAYDIGHVTLLVANVIEDDLLSLPWVAGARRVGLDVQGAAGLLGAMSIAPSDTRWLVSLSEASAALTEWGMLPEGHARQVLHWLERVV